MSKLTVGSSLLAFLLMFYFSADSQSMMGARKRATVPLSFTTIASTSTFDPFFEKNGTQSVTLYAGDSVKTGLDFSITFGYGGEKPGRVEPPDDHNTIWHINMATDSLIGPTPDLSASTALVFFFANDNLFTAITSLSANANLVSLYLYNNQLTGSIPSLSANTALEYFYVYNNQLTGYTASTLALTLVDFNASINELSSAAVNQILADFVTNLESRPVSGNINLGGAGNAAPTGQGLTDKATIIAYGWTVTTN